MRLGIPAMAIIMAAYGPGLAQDSTAQAPPEPISLNLALLVTTEALKQAAAAQAPSAVAVVDSAGELKILERMDGARKAAADRATGEARAAARWRVPTDALGKRADGGRIAIMGAPVTALPGGVPIFLDGRIIGAVGVSGLDPATDVQVATKAVEAASAAR